MKNLNAVFQRRFLFRNLAVVALVAVTSVYLNGTNIFLPDNFSYLSNYKYQGVSFYESDVFGGKKDWASMSAFTSLSDERESRKNYGLLNPYDEARYHRQFIGLASSALSELQGFHLHSLKSSASDGAKKKLAIESLKASKSPLLLVGVAAAVYSGRTMHYRLSDDLALESQTQMSHSQLSHQYLGWSSQELGASVGGVYGREDQSMSFSVRKSLSSNVGVNYDKTAENSVGINYSSEF